MWRNACNGCQYMPQVSRAVDMVVGQGGGTQSTTAHPDACSKFFRQPTERAAFTFMRHSEEFNKLCCSRLGLPGSRKSGKLGFRSFMRMDTGNGICATA